MSMSFHCEMCLSWASVACNAPDVAELHVTVSQDHGSEAYQADLSLLHIASARRLRQLCQSNAGIYIKAAQLMSTAQAIPQEYRKCVPEDLVILIAAVQLWSSLSFQLRLSCPDANQDMVSETTMNASVLPDSSMGVNSVQLYSLQET